jgi:hypothetical protein
MSSKTGQNTVKWIRVRLSTSNGLVETLIKKRHVTEGKIPKDDRGFYLVDKYGCTIHFYEWESIEVAVPELNMRKKNKYGGYDK